LYRKTVLQAKEGEEGTEKENLSMQRLGVVQTHDGVLCGRISGYKHACVYCPYEWQL
jgi:hypothetical protein